MENTQNINLGDDGLIQEEEDYNQAMPQTVEIDEDEEDEEEEEEKKDVKKTKLIDPMELESYIQKEYFDAIRFGDVHAIISDSKESLKTILKQ